MTINMTKDIESINAGGIRSLTKRQIKYALITAGIVLPVTIGLNMLNVNVTLACVIAAALGAPVARIGFFQKYGMNYKEYKQAQKVSERQEPLFYVSTESPIYQSRDLEEKELNGDLIDRIVKAMLKKQRRGEIKDGSK